MWGIILQFAHWPLHPSKSNQNLATSSSVKIKRRSLHSSSSWTVWTWLVGHPNFSRESWTCSFIIHQNQMLILHSSSSTWPDRGMFGVRDYDEVSCFVQITKVEWTVTQIFPSKVWTCFFISPQPLPLLKQLLIHWIIGEETTLPQIAFKRLKLKYMSYRIFWAPPPLQQDLLVAQTQIFWITICTCRRVGRFSRQGKKKIAAPTFCFFNVASHHQSQNDNFQKNCGNLIVEMIGCAL